MTECRPKLKAIPMTIKRANEYVAKWHRHHRPIQGGLFAVSVARAGEDEPCGVAVVGRCNARLFDPSGMTAEVTRIATDGTPNACSKLLGICRSVAFKLGYERVTTYTLPEEGGASLRAAGMGEPVEAGGGEWNSPSRPRETGKYPTGKKHRYTATKEPT